MKIENDLEQLTATLKHMRAAEKIPAPHRRASIRAQLVGKFAPIQLTAFRTKIGWIGVAYTERGIVTLKLPRGSRAASLASLRSEYANAIIVERAPAQILNEISEYAQGERRKFDLKLDWSSLKPFQREVLRAANQIPFGETRSYGWVAQQIGKPRAARAVGRALATNPIPILLPCHRVLGSDGSLHGYAGGLSLKARLLKIEGVKIANAFVVA